jgi:hypothetical protein
LDVGRSLTLPCAQLISSHVKKPEDLVDGGDGAGSDEEEGEEDKEDDDE